MGVARALLSWAENDAVTNWVYLVVIIFLVCGAGMMSGLTLGLLSLDHMEIEVLKRSGTASQKR